MLSDFKQFAFKGNVMDLAIGVIIGAAFGKIISSLVDDVIMPLLNPLIPGGAWQETVVGPGIKLGSFGAAVLNFIIIAMALFVVLRIIARLRRKDAETPAKPAAPTITEQLLTEIRDSLKNPSVPR